MECPEPEVRQALRRATQPRPCEIDPHLRLRPRPRCHDRLSCDLQAFTLPEFTSSLRIALLVLFFAGATLLTRRALRARRGLRPGVVQGFAGALLAAAAAAAYRETGHLLPGLALAIALLFLGGVIADAIGTNVGVHAILALPGGLVLASQTALAPLVPVWVRVLVALAPAIGGALMADLDRRGADLGLGPVLLAVTFVGLYETVPDTDLALVLIATGLPLALLAWPVPLTSFGGGGSAVAVGLLCFVAAVGGRGRLSGVVGGVACLGLFISEPLARLLHPGTRTLLERVPRRAASTVGVALVHLALVYACSRIAGLQTTVAPAVVIATLVLVAGAGSAILGANLLRRRGEDLGRSESSDGGGSRLVPD